MSGLQKRSMAQFHLADKYCCISNASKLKVLSALTEDRSMTSIAREHNVSVNTVQRVLASCSHHLSTVMIICQNTWLLTNSKASIASCTLSVLMEKTWSRPDSQNTAEKHLLRYFGKFTPQARDNAKTVTMDLNFTIRISLELASLKLRSSSIASTWFKCLPGRSTLSEYPLWRDSTRDRVNINCSNLPGNSILKLQRLGQGTSALQLALQGLSYSRADRSRRHWVQRET